MEADYPHEFWNPAPAPYPARPVQRIFEATAGRSPDAVALVCGTQNISYRELNARANRLARYLVRSGLGPGNGVAILMDRGVEQVVALLAILKAGGVYIPLDPGFPAARVEQMLEDARPAKVLCFDAVPEWVGAPEADTLCLAMAECEMAALSDENLNIDRGLDDSAYIMYTSGSTGRPKGVEVVHRGIVRLLFGADYVPLDSSTVVLHIAASSFDASTFEIWAPLLHGGTCVLCPERIPTLETMGSLIAEHRVNTIFITSALFNLVVDEAPEILLPVRYLLTGGEVLSCRHMEKALQLLPGARLVNVYGPTENTTFSTSYAIDRATFDPEVPTPIGRPIANSTCYILDDSLHPVAVGMEGELYVGGDGVAKGYAGQPELTRQSFLSDPFRSGPSARMYRTGDMARWNRDGFIEFIGRKDRQIKLRGFRIELQDIDSALQRFPEAGQVVTEIYEDDGTGKWLAAFIKTDVPEDFPVDALEKFAREVLPDYMLPAVFVPVRDLPLASTGKLDRKALPKPELKTRSRRHAPPESNVQRQLAEIWSRLLKLDNPGIDDDFFDLGGDSLLGVRLMHEISRRFGRDLPLAMLMQYPTVRGLAEMVEGQERLPELFGFRALQMVQRGNDEKPPLFMIHGGAGNVVVFRKFARNLGEEQPVYAFQWPGWDGSPAPRGIVALAAAYKDELIRFRRADAYRLGGHCIGGLIAIELARQLRKDGIGIEGPLVVSDCPNLASKHFWKQEPESTPQSRQAFSSMTRELVRLGGNADSSELKPVHGVAGLLRRMPVAVSLVRWTKLVPSILKIRMALLLGRKVPVNLRQTHSSISLLSAARHHSYHPYDVDVIYFRSDCTMGRSFGLSGWWDDPFLGFPALCGGRFSGHVLGGEHNELLDKPEVADLVKESFFNKK